MRQRDTSITDFYGMRRIPGKLAVTCHCEAVVLMLPVAEIRACRTASCGLPGCVPDEVEAA